MATQQKPRIKRVKNRITKEWVWCLYEYKSDGTMVPIAAAHAVPTLCKLVRLFGS